MTMNKILEGFVSPPSNQNLNPSFKEASGLSQIQKNIASHDCGTISAFRGSYSKEDNLKRNASLRHRLNNAGMSVTPVKGGYVENYGSSNAKPVNENSFFVVDTSDKGTLKKVLAVLGSEFEQDSIMFIPKGGQNAFLLGTSPFTPSQGHSPYPSRGDVVPLDNLSFGTAQKYNNKDKKWIGDESKMPMFYSKKMNKVFFFESTGKEHCPPDNPKSAAYCRHFAEKDWKTLSLVDEEDAQSFDAFMERVAKDRENKKGKK